MDKQILLSYSDIEKVLEALEYPIFDDEQSSPKFEELYIKINKLL